MASTEPRRGEVWLTSLGASRPGEPGKNRPVIVVSDDRVIAGSPREPIVVVPLSSSVPASALRPEVTEAEGVEQPSRAVCGAVRGVARSRLLRRLGVARPTTLDEVELALMLVLGLEPTR
ncbi:MAG TPA: type II toxin-antitoxin system PemK/MazF family toxin [Solirubrobacteraceae bacterium]|jgi:mRNA interferase MazF|nr:type II toxin-antitoxin system PemK/MazF family toxin [Solirubrobacteraceae bacterium]